MAVKAAGWKRFEVMITGKRILVGVTGILLLAGGIGAGIAATDGSGEGRMQSGWHGRHAAMGDRAGIQMGDSGRGRPGSEGRGGPRAQMTDEELDTRIRERFARIDRNSDGVIDRGEVEAMMAAGGREHGMRQGGREGGREDGSQAGRLLQRFDENRDGKVTKDEFMNGIKRRFNEIFQ